MLFNSLDFLIFFPIVVSVYFVVPSKFKNNWLLISSYFFYMNWNPKYGLLLFLCSFITYLAALVIQKINDSVNDKAIQKRRLLLAISLLIIFSTLFFYKYFNFTLSNLQSVLNYIGVNCTVPAFDIVLPVGISFFTFQAAGYLIDVYRKEIYAERNFFRYALFVSFFPQLVAGPIERSKNLLKQLDRTYQFDYYRARDGLLLMIWGLFLKMVIADRASIFVNTIYKDFDTCSGALIIIATFLFAFQIYCDFCGYSIIAMGAARILGLKLMDNFNCPYFSKSVAEFWRRWHISLSSWFRDYLYFPLGGSRCSKFRRYVNIMVVFLISGLWHGSNWNFIVWGGLNGIYQVIGDILKPARLKIQKIFHINSNSVSHKLLQIGSTFFLIDFSWLFFRAGSLNDGIEMLKKIIYELKPSTIFNGALFQYGLDEKNFKLLMLSIFILIAADTVKYFGIQVRQWIVKQDWWFTESIFIFSILFITITGIWGNTYDSAGFIYFQF